MGEKAGEKKKKKNRKSVGKRNYRLMRRSFHHVASEREERHRQMFHHQGNSSVCPSSLFFSFSVCLENAPAFAMIWPSPRNLLCRESKAPKNTSYRCCRDKIKNHSSEPGLFLSCLSIRTDSKKSRLISYRFRDKEVAGGVKDTKMDEEVNNANALSR